MRPRVFFAPLLHSPVDRAAPASLQTVASLGRPVFTPTMGRRGMLGIAGYWRRVALGPVIFLLVPCMNAAAGMPEPDSRFWSISSDPASLQVEDFLSSMGVNTHLQYTDGGYAQVGKVIDDLRYLGITHVRDSLTVPFNSDEPAVAAYEDLVKNAGVRFTFMVGGGGELAATGGTATIPSLQQRVEYIAELAEVLPGSVAAVEGTNEINNQPIVYDGHGRSGRGTDELDAAISMQRDLYRLVHTDPRLTGVPVYYFTGYGTPTIPIGPDPANVPNLADFDTQHPYPNSGEPPAFWLARKQALGNETAENARRRAPAVYTETGYNSSGGTAGGVNYDVQMKYTLDLFLDAAKSGISATFLYELLDAYPPGSPQGNVGFGLFDYQGNPKPVAKAIHNMVSILRSNLQPSLGSVHGMKLPYRLSGQSKTGNDLVLSVSRKRHVIALWDEQPIWRSSDGVALAPTSHQVTVDFDHGKRFHVAQYEPTIGENSIAAFKAINRLAVRVSDHPVLLVVDSLD